MPLNINEDMPIGRPPSGKIGSQPAGALATATDLISVPSQGAAAPTALPSSAKAAMGPPDVIPALSSDRAAPPFPLSHARILWNNLLIGAVVTVTDPVSITFASRILTPATYSRANIAASGGVLISRSTAAIMDGIGIAAHTFAGVGLLIQTRESDAAPWLTKYNGTPLNNASIFLVFPEQNVKHLLITVTLPAGITAAVGVVYAGACLQMQRPVYKDVAPVNMSRETQYTNNVSEGGQWLGRDIIRQGLKNKQPWRRLDPFWYRTYFEPFASAARRTPFFYSWNPLEFPNDVAYCWTSKDIQPTITGPRDLMSVEIEMEGHA